MAGVLAELSDDNVEAVGHLHGTLQSLHGSITPNGLHFERSHNGVPDIDPARHELLPARRVNQSFL